MNSGCGNVKFMGALPSVYRCHMLNISLRNLNLHLDWISVISKRKISVLTKRVPGTQVIEVYSYQTLNDQSIA